MHILFVCTGNICRSPTADGMLRHMLQQAGITGIAVDSAGVASAHIGEAPDPRSQKAAQTLGYDLSALRARNVVPEDFDDFDLILAMDSGHLAALQRRQHKTSNATVRLFLDGQDVPDPYYDGPEAFDEVARMIEAGCRELFLEISPSRNT